MNFYFQLNKTLKFQAVYHHHGDQHSSRVKRLLKDPESADKFHPTPECLQGDLFTNPGGGGGGTGGPATPGGPLTGYKGELEWEDRVCSTSTLDDRVRELLKALDQTCPDHKVCQILSPEILQRLARPDQCRLEARDLWKTVFHRLYLMIRDFSDVLQQKFDIGDYSLFENIQQNQRCKVGHFLPIKD